MGVGRFLLSCIDVLKCVCLNGMNPIWVFQVLVLAVLSSHSSVVSTCLFDFAPSIGHCDFSLMSYGFSSALFTPL